MLTISRRDIEHRFLTEYPLPTRFIKLPIKPYLELLGIWETTNAPQIALLNAINSPQYRFICAALARRLGKTYIVNVAAQLVQLVPNSHVLIMSPNYNLSGISFELQRKLIRHFDLEITRDNLKDKIIELSNGSSVRMGSVLTVDSCVGRSYDLILFDEAALGADGEEAFNVALRPTLDKPGAKAVFISTPRGKNNWFSKFFQRGFSPDYPQWCSITADWTENPRMSAKDVEEAQKAMSKAEFEQEYMASFTVFEGQIFEVPLAQQVPFEHEDGCEYFAGLDPGYKDPTAFIVMVYNPNKDVFHIIDEYLESEKTTAQHAERWHEMIAQYHIEVTFIDSAAAQFASDLAYIHNIATIKGKKDVLPGIAYVQTLLQQKRLFIDPKCELTLVAFDQYQWDTRDTLTKEKPKHANSHIPDAVRYAFYTYTI